MPRLNQKHALRLRVNKMVMLRLAGYKRLGARVFCRFYEFSSASAATAAFSIVSVS
jgi:hypothetical protein